MLPDELDIAIDELETRLERLRSLYQQYFLGIEKLEPTIARKDVDRRIWALRKQQIRNTGKRFRLNVLIQRYNTFQQYWQRICREIENGTYRQHVLRAERTVGSLDAVPAGRRRKKTRREEEAAAEAAEKAREATRQAEEDLQAALSESLDPIDDIKRAMDEALGDSLAPPGGADAEERIPRAPPVPRTPGQGISALDLELDGDELKTPLRPPPPSGESARPAAPAKTPEPSGSPRPAEAAARSPGPGPARPVPAKRGLPAPRARLSKGVPTSTPAEAPRPATPAEKPAGRNPFASPDGPNPFSSGGVSEQRIKQLHEKLVDAKRRTNDASRVTEEGLARSLRSAEAKLRKQHGKARRIDFDVVVKNGKAVVKPIVSK